MAHAGETKRSAPPAVGTVAGAAWVLAGVAGWVDAAGFLTLGGLFTAQMTGNSVTFASYAGRGLWSESWPHLFAVPVFLLGVFAGTLWMTRKAARRPERWVFVVEALLLAGLAWVLAVDPAPIQGSVLYFAAAVLALLAMGLQNSTVHRLGMLSVNSTYVTGLLTACAVQAAQTWSWWRAETAGRGALRRRRALAVLRRQESFVSASCAGGLWLCYLAGALASTVALVGWGPGTLAAPVVALGWIAARWPGSPAPAKPARGAG